MARNTASLILMLTLFIGCGTEPPPAEIPLYQGHVAKSKGRIVWFPSEPKFDEAKQMWIGRDGVEITSCIADPWPSDEGGHYAHTQVGQEQNSYTTGRP